MGCPPIGSTPSVKTTSPATVSTATPSSLIVAEVQRRLQLETFTDLSILIQFGTYLAS